MSAGWSPYQRHEAIRQFVHVFADLKQIKMDNESAPHPTVQRLLALVTSFGRRATMSSSRPDTPTVSITYVTSLGCES